MIGKKKEQVSEEVQKYICTKWQQVGDRGYAPGEFISVPEGTILPAEFMRCDFVPPPYFFALREINRRGRTIRLGELWPFREPPPAPHFAPLEDRELYEKFKVSNGFELRKKSGV